MAINLKFNLSSGIIPFMFGAYKFGLYAPDINPWAVSRFNIREKDQLEKTQCLKITMCDGIGRDVRIPIIQLTYRGLDLLQRNFTNILIEKSLYYTYSAIKRGDKINVIDPICNDNKKGRKFVSGIGGVYVNIVDSGTYTVESIERPSVIVSDNMNICYRIKLFDTKSNLVLRGDQLEDNDIELKNRFSQIKFKSVIKKLARVINNLTLTEIVDDLYDNALFKDRLNGER